MKSRTGTVFKAVLLALILSVIFSLFLTVIVYSLDVPDGLLRIIMFLIAATAILCSAFSACKSLSSKGLITGGTIGLIYYIALMIIATLIKKEFSFDARATIMLFASLLSGMLGGILGIQR